MTEDVRILAFICICLGLAFVGLVGNQMVKNKAPKQTKNDHKVTINSLEGEN